MFLLHSANSFLSSRAKAPKSTLSTSRRKILLLLMRRFMKADILDGISGKALQKIDFKKKQNQLKLEDTEVGAKAKRLLGKLSPID